MGLRAIIAQVIDQVGRVSPIIGTEQTFAVLDDATGGVATLEEAAALGSVQERLCDVRVTSWPADDGVACATAGKRLRTGLALRVWYFAEGSRTWLEQRMVEDVERVLRRLGDPSNWDATTTLTDAWVFERSRPTATEVRRPGAKPEEGPMGYILAIPFEVIYREA